MYFGELLQYYQSSNNLPQSAQTLDFDLKSCFVLRRFCSTLPVALLVVDLPSSHCLLLWTSSRSALCRLLCLNLCCFGLVCLGPRVALLVVDLSPSQTLPLWFAQHLELICSLLSCPDCFNLSCFVLKPRLALLAVQLSLAAI